MKSAAVVGGARRASLDKYLYANADPLLYLDPSGNASLLEIGVSLAIGTTLSAIAYPHIETAVGTIFAKLGLSPNDRYSLSSLGVYDDAALLIGDFSMGMSDFSGNLLASAAQSIATDIIAGKTAGAGIALSLKAFAKFKASRLPTPANHSDQLSLTGREARENLRRNLGYPAPDEAHHIIPWSMREHPVVVRASRQGFNMNGAMNGIPLDPFKHRAGSNHPAYNEAIRTKLNSLQKSATDHNFSDLEVSVLLQDYMAQLRRGMARDFGHLR